MFWRIENNRSNSTFLGRIGQVGHIFCEKWISSCCNFVDAVVADLYTIARLIIPCSDEVLQFSNNKAGSDRHITAGLFVSPSINNLSTTAIDVIDLNDRQVCVGERKKLQFLNNKACARRHPMAGLFVSPSTNNISTTAIDVIDLNDRQVCVGERKKLQFLNNKACVRRHPMAGLFVSPAVIPL